MSKAIHYSYTKGIVRSKISNTKKIIIATAASLGVVGVMAVPTFANQASSCGATHGAFANQNGNFGFLGQVGGTPGYHDGAVGQDPGATGYNNSNTDCQQ